LSTTLQPYTTPTGELSRRERINLFTPYDITKSVGFYEPLLEERRQQLQQNTLINQLKKDIEEGKPVSQEGIQVALGAQAEKTGEPLSVLVERAKLQAQYEKANDLFDLYLRAQNDAVRTKIEQSVAKMGIDPTEGLYNYLTTRETAPKTEYIKAIISQNPNTDIIELLSPYRKEGIASGKPLLSDGVIDNLYDEGLITADQKKYLKNLRWDAKQKKVVPKAGTGKKKGVKFKAPTISVAKPPTVKIKPISYEGILPKIQVQGYTPQPLTMGRGFVRIVSGRPTDLERYLRQGIKKPTVRVVFGR